MPELLRRLWDEDRAQVFLHCATSVSYLAELHRSIPEVQYFPERALLLARRGDIVCVADEVEPAYLDYLAELKIGPDRDGVIAASQHGQVDASDPLWKAFLENDAALAALSELMCRRRAAALHPFMATGGQYDLALALGERLSAPVRVAGGDPDLVAYADLKHHIRRAALELGVPVAPGEVVELEAGASTAHQARMLRLAIRRHAESTGRAIVRGAAGAAGSATFVVSCQDAEIDELVERLSGWGENRIYLVESMVEPVASPNIQIHVDARDGSLECVGISDQQLSDGLVHTGNGHPSAARCLEDMVRWAGVLARWLRDAGYAGIAGFDFVEYLDARGTPRAFLAELNPRVNGATYPLALFERIGMAPAFMSGTLHTEARTFGELRHLLSDLLYRPGKSAGVVPYATGCLRQGRCPVVALAPSRSQAAQLFAEAQLVLEGVCVT